MMRSFLNCFRLILLFGVVLGFVLLPFAAGRAWQAKSMHEPAPPFVQERGQKKTWIVERLTETEAVLSRGADTLVILPRHDFDKRFGPVVAVPQEEEE